MVFERLPEFIDWGKKTKSLGSTKRSKITHYKFDSEDTGTHIWLSLTTNAKILELNKQVQKQYGEIINTKDISTDNQKTLELFQKGDIEGVYQRLQDKWAKKKLVEFQPDSFYDLLIINTLYRPEPEIDDRFAILVQRKKKGKRRFSQLIKDLFPNPNDLSATVPIMNKDNAHLFECDDLLFGTYGLIIFQEQMMELAQKIADFSPEESNDLRKILGKKQKTKLETYEKEFFERGQAKGHPLAGLKSLWKEWEENIIYYYPKGSAVAKTTELFQIAYFKAHYREAFNEVNKKIW